MSTERKVAVVTGASQGIGAGLVRGFLDKGYRVVANSRSIKPDGSADVLAVPGDIADPAVAARVIAEAVARYGRVDTREGVTTEQKAALIKGATDLLKDVLGKDPNLTFVIIQEVEPENWGAGGLPTSEFRKRQTSSG